MPYDKELDKELFSESVEFERTKITVSIFCYNEGQKKMQLSRMNKTMDGDTSWAKLGRLTKEEAEAVIPIMTKALEQL